MKLLTLVLVLAGSINLFGQNERTDEPKISQLNWMIGEWQGKEPGDSGELLVRMTVRKSENQQAILYYVWFDKDGKVTPRYNGIYYWNPAEKTIKMLQVSADGNVAEGTYEQTGNHASQLAKTVTANSSFELKSEYDIKPGEFHFVGQFRPAGKTEWVPAVEVTYTKLVGK